MHIRPIQSTGCPEYADWEAAVVNAADIMTRELVVVAPDCRIADIATAMIENHISGVLVVDAGKLVGIVTERDLLRRAELNTEHQRPRWVQFLTSDAVLLGEYIRSHGQTASDVMTPNVLVVSPDTPIVEIADIFESRHIKRVPVLDGEKLVGIVSRANLVQALATQAPMPAQSAEASDSKIRDLLYDEVAKIGRAPQPIMNNVTVSNGVVHLWRFVSGEAERKAILIAARAIPGVTEVKDHRTGIRISSLI
jgi:CBS domain-containing protein